MQGPQDRDHYPEDTSSTGQYRPLNGNDVRSRRPLPTRPATMPRVKQPPTTRRVGRPPRQDSRLVNWRRRILIWLGIFLVFAVASFMIGYALQNLIAASNATAGSATTATDFLQAITSQNYSQAYNDLGANITVQLSPEDFNLQAQSADRCYGKQTRYSEIANSATIQGSTQSYSYTITRTKLSQPYTLRLSLTQNSDGNWRIASYGTNNDLGPEQPPCT